MKSKCKLFSELHRAKELLVLPNAWDARSALLLQQQGFAAIATSSAAVAESLGYNDGEQMSFEEYLFVIKRILSVIEVPLTVDIETGYGHTDSAIYANIKKLTDLGVAGINIEDSVITPTGSVLKEAESFAATITYIKDRLAQDRADLFINIRCDTYILDVANKQQETKRRLSLYDASGADGVFLPCIREEKDIAAAVQNTLLPVNVMCIPGLPAFEVLQQIGVKRATMGPFLFHKVYTQIASVSQSITSAQNFAALLA